MAVDDHPRPAGPQDVEDAGDVARRDGVGLGREAGSGQDLEPVRMGQEKVVEDLVEVVALCLGGEGVGDRDLGPEPQGGRDLAELEVEVEQDDRLVRGPGQELGGIGGQERLAAAAGRRRDHDDPTPARPRPVRRRAQPGPGDAGRPGQRGAELGVVGVKGDEVVRPHLDDLGQVGPGSLVEGQHQRHPGVVLVEGPEAAQPGPVHERRTGDDDVPGSGSQERLRPGQVGAALHDRGGPDDVVADAGRQLAGAVDDQHPRLGGAHRVVTPPVAIRCTCNPRRRCPRRRT